MENKKRLAKRIAESGISSRREAERLILDGRVAVNGETITTPVFFVNEDSIVTIDGTTISSKKHEIKIWKFHKPRGVITTKRDPQNRKTVFEFLKGQDQRLIYIGRLDYNSEGLLLFTNNGNVARKSELPSTALKRTYKVRIFGHLSEESIKKLKNGVTIDGVKYGPVEVTPDYINQQQKTARRSLIATNSWIIVSLSEGKNREIRKLMEYFGCKVNRLIRISYGPFELGQIGPGEVLIEKKNLVDAFVKSIGALI